jgi:hypothetical protein
MYQLNDDNHLDLLSKHAADNYDAPHNPSWEAVQRRLDQELPVKKEKRRRGVLFFILMVALLATGGVLWYSSSTKNNSARGGISDKKIASPTIIQTPVTANNQLSKKTSTVSPQPKLLTNVEPGKEENETPVYINNKQIEKIPGIPKTDAKQPVVVNKKPVKPFSPASRNSIPDNSAITNLPGKEKPSVVSTSPVKRAKPAGSFVKSKAKKSSRTQKEEIVPDAIVEPGREYIVSANEKNADITSLKKESSIPNLPPANTDSVKQAPATINHTPAAATTSNGQKNKKAAPHRFFSVALLTGTDISTIKFKYADDPGIHAGIIAGYHFNKKWSLHTGAVYTKSNYKLAGSDYHPPKHYWTQYVRLETVQGDCRMWEIPVQLRYLLNPAANNRWFVSGGVSSYLMKKQQYDYTYKNNTGVPVTRSWQTDSASNYMFSVVHLSAGWEKSLGKRLNLQVEPYTKIPLSGLGFGSIRLTSFGINFSIQWKQPIKP